MALQKVEAFLKTVELGSLTLAGQALGRTQSAISHSITSFEEELGLSLLKRDKGGVRLTPNGKLLLPHIRALFEAQERLKEEAERLGSASGGRVRIGAFTSVAVHWLPGMIKEAEARYPSLHLELLNGDYSDVDRWLKEGQVDLAFITLPAPEGCVATPLKEDELVAILPPEHPLSRFQRIEVEKLAEEPFITLLQSSNQDIRRAMGEHQPRVRFSTKDDYAIIAMVEEGLGVSIMPRLLLDGRQDRVSVRPLKPTARRTIALARREGPVTPAAALFYDCALRWAEERT